MFGMLKVISTHYVNVLILVVEQIILVVIVIKCQLLSIERRYENLVIKFDLNNEVNAVSVNGITTFHFSFRIKLPRLSSIAVQPGLRHMVCSILNHDVLYPPKPINLCLHLVTVFFFLFLSRFLLQLVFSSALFCVLYLLFQID